MHPDLAISKIGPESDVLLRNLSGHYCHDMSEWFDLDVGADGLYSYDTASVWTKGYDAYLAKVGDSIAGFALIGSGGEWLVRVVEANAPAVTFWRGAISSYSGGSYREMQRIVNGRPWKFFRFVSNRANR